MKFRYKAALCGTVGLFAFAGLDSPSSSPEEKTAFGQALTEETNDAFAGRNAFEMGRFDAAINRYVSVYGAQHGDVGRIVNRVAESAGWDPTKTPEQAKVAACSTALISLKLAGSQVSQESITTFNTPGQELVAATQCVKDLESAVVSGVTTNVQFVNNLA